MKTITYTKARGNLSNTMVRVCEDHDPVIITRSNNEPVVMISLEDYDALSETAYLLQSPKNASRLLKSIKELEKGKGKQRELIE